MEITIKEKIKYQRGVTRYCNCENSHCGHGNRPCMDNATVVATLHSPAYGNQTEQLCAACLAEYRKA